MLILCRLAEIKTDRLSTAEGIDERKYRLEQRNSWEEGFRQAGQDV